MLYFLVLYCLTSLDMEAKLDNTEISLKIIMLIISSRDDDRKERKEKRQKDDDRFGAVFKKYFSKYLNI